MDYYEQDNCISCYHIYQKISTAEVDEHFVCEKEPLNSSDRYAVAVLKDDIVVVSCHKFCPCYTRHAPAAGWHTPGF